MFQNDSTKAENCIKIHDSKRRILKEQIFEEVQHGYYQFSPELVKSIYNEINNFSDYAIDIMLRNKGLYD